MQITINNTPVEVVEGETIIETARRAGHAIPSLCYAKGAVHKSSCMVCAVKNCANGQIIPSCTTLPTEGMQIETNCAEVIQVRTLSLELLLSDHRADCEAPCSLVCPKGLDVEQMLSHWDGGSPEGAYALIAAAFALPVIGCDDCKALCEKACRRGAVDKSVAIRDIIRQVVSRFSPPLQQANAAAATAIDKAAFRSTLGRFTEAEKEQLAQTVNTPSRCLHCACAGKSGCKLRRYATEAGIKRSRYAMSSQLPVMQRQPLGEKLCFEPAKCIRCGLCVYNSTDGFTFKDRGFGMQVVLPEENKSHASATLAALCPTGALYIQD